MTAPKAGDSIPQLGQAIMELATRCDGACTEDGVGFNGADSYFGKSLAEQPEEGWSPKQRFFAWKMLRTYKVQLLNYGVNYDQIPVPPNLDEIEHAFQEKRKKQAATARREICLNTSKAEIWFPYDPALVQDVKTLPGRRFKKLPKPHWEVPISDTTAKALLELANLADLPMSYTDRERLEQLAQANEKTAGLSDAMSMEGFEVRPGLGGTLEPFQEVAVAYTSQKKKVLCGDEMGLGKTMEALGTIHQCQSYPALVTVPATLKPNWLREAAKWLPYSVKIGQLEGTKLTAKNQYVMDSCDVVIVNYDLLGWTGKKKGNPGHPTKLTTHLLKKEWKALIADECHLLKNYKAQRSCAMQALAKGPEIVMGLTGTPILNRPQELVNILQVLGRLDDMGGFWQFLNNCGVNRGEWGGLSHTGTAEQLEVVHEKLRATCMIRRKKEQVMKDLPAKRRATVPLAITNMQEYKEAARGYVAWLQKQGKTEAAEKAGMAEHLTRIEGLKKLAVNGKLGSLIDWTNNFLESGEKLVLFAHHKDIQKALITAFPGCCRLVSEDKATKRDEQVQKFSNDPAVKLIVVSLKAGGVGVDGLQHACTNVAFAELGWTPGDMDQAEDRLHRKGQVGSVTVWYLLAQNTIEEEIAQLIDAKRVVVAALSDGDASQGEQGSILKALRDSILKAA